MSKVITIQDGNITFNVLSSEGDFDTNVIDGNINLGADGNFTGTINLGTFVDIDETTGALSIFDSTFADSVAISHDGTNARITTDATGGNIILETDDNGGATVTDFGLELRGSSNTDGDPEIALEDQDTALYLYSNSGSLIGEFAFNDSSTLEIWNDIWEGRTELYTTDAAGGSIAQIYIDPLARIEFFLHEAGRIASFYETGTDGRGSLSLTGGIAGNDTGIDLVDDILTGVVQGSFGFSGSDNLIISNSIDAGLVVIQGDATGGATRTLISMDPDDDVALFDAGTEVARTLPAASGGFQVNNTLTGVGFERVLTASDVSTGNVSNTGTPVNNQIAIWTDATTIEGDADLTFDGSSLLQFQSGAAFIRSEITSSGGSVRVQSADGGDTAGFYLENSDTGAGGGALVINNTTGRVSIEQTNDTGTTFEDIWINLQRNGAVQLYHNGTQMTRTADAATGAFEINNTVTGAGFERVLTTSDIATTAATVQTTNATQTEIIAVSVASGEGFGFEIYIIGTEDATGDTVFERIFGAIRNQGGTTALVGSSIVDRTDDAGATTWVITVAADDTSDELTVDVTGEAAHTIDWRVKVQILDV